MAYSDPEEAKAYKRRWAKTPKGREKNRREHLKRYYGISIEEYDRMARDQRGVCAICERPERSARHRNGRLAIDHCHGTGVVRGLLCTTCNAALGGMNDNVAWIRRMIDYLEKPRELVARAVGSKGKRPGGVGNPRSIRTVEV